MGKIFICNIVRQDHAFSNECMHYCSRKIVALTSAKMKGIGTSTMLSFNLNASSANYLMQKRMEFISKNMESKLKVELNGVGLKSQLQFSNGDGRRISCFIRYAIKIYFDMCFLLLLARLVNGLNKLNRLDSHI